MSNPHRTLADRLVAAGYASFLKPISYGLTKQTIYEVFVEDEGWQTVDPFGNESYSKAQFHALQDYKAMMDALDK